MTPHNPLALPAAYLDQPLAALPDDASDARLPIFTRERQAAFLQALAACGVARRASGLAGVSYRTAYRERRANPAFRRAWDAALLAARALSEDVLATRALDGVEEEVWYHGEVVATRRRFDSRLLLAHLARLDRLTEDVRTRAFAEDYEGALERFAAGEDDPAPVCETCGEALPMVPVQGPDERGEGGEAAGQVFAPGQGDKCDSAPPACAEPAAAAAAAPAEEEPEEPCPGCGGWCTTPGAQLTQDDCMWLGNRLDRMDAARPRGAIPIGDLTDADHEAGDVEYAQLLAFEDGEERWWEVTPGGLLDDIEDYVGMAAADEAELARGGA